jgi:hypothetical protein
MRDKFDSRWMKVVMDCGEHRKFDNFDLLKNELDPEIDALVIRKGLETMSLV